jgi:hypothetical protein
MKSARVGSNDSCRLSAQITSQTFSQKNLKSVACFSNPKKRRPLTTLATLFTANQPPTTTFCAHTSPETPAKTAFSPPHHAQKKQTN